MSFGFSYCSFSALRLTPPKIRRCQTRVSEDMPKWATSFLFIIEYHMNSFKPKLTTSTMEAVPRSEDLEDKLEHLLRFGKLIGAHQTGMSLIDRVTRVIPFILGVVALVDLIGICVMKPSTLQTATEVAGDFGVPGFYCLGTFLYYYMQRNAHQLDLIFENWKALGVQEPDDSLKRFVNLSSFCVLTSAILENAIFHLKLFPVFESPEEIGNKSSLEVFYNRSHEHWALYVPYNPVVSILLCITNKWALYVWNYADVLIACISRALSFRLGLIIKDPQDPRIRWEHIPQNFQEITKVAKMIENYFSPIIFVCYAMNMYAICMQLHMWLTPSENDHLLHTLYLAWSFVHLLGRVYLVSYNAAKVFEEVQLFLVKVHSCPESKSGAEIQRLELCGHGRSRGYGLTGLGCFVITKPFILSIFSVAFTFEVFLLQSDAIKLG